MGAERNKHKMSEIVTNVMGSPRLRRFTATYAMFYIVVVLVMNYIGGLWIFKSAPMSYVFSVLNFTVQAPLLFGCVRGIATREYNFGKGLSAFGEVDKYPHYLAYIALNVVYEIAYGLVSPLANGEGTMATVGLVLSGIMVVVRFAVNFLLVGLFFDAVFGVEKPSLSPGRILKRFSSAVADHPGKVLGAEIFMAISSYLSLYIAAMLAELFPAHWIVSYVLTCFVQVQFGFIVLSWPIYYLYCKKIYGITDFEEPKKRLY